MAVIGGSRVATSNNATPAAVATASDGHNHFARHGAACACAATAVRMRVVKSLEGWAEATCAS
jgi:hypothetical protein